MTWPTTNIPPEITQMRTHLVASAAFVAAFGGTTLLATARVHYPACDVSGEDGGTPDTTPCALIERGVHRGHRFADGAGALHAGNLAVTLYFPVDSTYQSAAEVEYQADLIARQVIDQDYGLPLGDFSVGLASDPTPMAVAADTAARPTKFRSIRIDFDYGLSA